MKLSCIAVDDEVLALSKIKRFISKLDFIDLKNSFDNAKDAIEYLQSNPIDLILLDIEMPEISGFQFLNLLEQKTHVILTTAFDQYALKSYDFDVDDYLLKPIQLDRFVKAIEKVYSTVINERKLSTNQNVSKNQKDYIFIKSSGKIVKIPIDEINYIEGMKDYLSINLKDKRYLTLMSFSNLMENLPKELFIRTHKSFIVAISKIQEIQTNCIIVNNKSIPISRTYKGNILKYKSKII